VRPAVLWGWVVAASRAASAGTTTGATAVASAAVVLLALVLEGENGGLHLLHLGCHRKVVWGGGCAGSNSGVGAGGERVGIVWGCSACLVALAFFVSDGVVSEAGDDLFNEIGVVRVLEVR
jgi:hypothetical protein